MIGERYRVSGIGYRVSGRNHSRSELVSERDFFVSLPLCWMGFWFSAFARDSLQSLQEALLLSFSGPWMANARLVCLAKAGKQAFPSSDLEGGRVFPALQFASLMPHPLDQQVKEGLLGQPQIWSFCEETFHSLWSSRLRLGGCSSGHTPSPPFAQSSLPLLGDSYLTGCIRFSHSACNVVLGHCLAFPSNWQDMAWPLGPCLKFRTNGFELACL